VQHHQERTRVFVVEARRQDGGEEKEASRLRYFQLAGGGADCAFLDLNLLVLPTLALRYGRF